MKILAPLIAAGGGFASMVIGGVILVARNGAVAKAIGRFVGRALGRRAIATVTETTCRACDGTCLIGQAHCAHCGAALPS